MKTFTPKEVVHAKGWDLAPEFKIVATGNDDPDDIKHVEHAVCRGLREAGARISAITVDPKVWLVKIPDGWEVPKKPVPPPDLVETEVDIEAFLKFRPWEVPALVRIRQRPSDSTGSISEFLHLVLPAVLKTNDCDIMDSSGSLKKGDAMILIWIRTSDEERAAMRAAIEIMSALVDTSDPEVSIPMKAQVLADLHPDRADKIRQMAEDALKLHRSRQ